jgi:hypothetical protein
MVRIFISSSAHFADSDRTSDGVPPATNRLRENTVIWPQPEHLISEEARSEDKILRRAEDMCTSSDKSNDRVRFDPSNRVLQLTRAKAVDMRTVYCLPRTASVSKTKRRWSNLHVCRLASIIQRKIESEFAFALDPFTIQTVNVDAWAVSTSRFETRLSRNPTCDELIRDLSKKLICIACCRERLYIGGWHNGRVFYLDLVRLVRDRCEALHVAQIERSKAICRLMAKAVTPVPGISKSGHAA